MLSSVKSFEEYGNVEVMFKTRQNVLKCRHVNVLGHSRFIHASLALNPISLSFARRANILYDKDEGRSSCLSCFPRRSVQCFLFRLRFSASLTDARAANVPSPLNDATNGVRCLASTIATVRPLLSLITTSQEAIRRGSCKACSVAMLASRSPSIVPSISYILISAFLHGPFLFKRRAGAIL